MYATGYKTKLYEGVSQEHEGVMVLGWMVREAALRAEACVQAEGTAKALITLGPQWLDQRPLKSSEAKKDLFSGA